MIASRTLASSSTAKITGFPIVFPVYPLEQMHETRWKGLDRPSKSSEPQAKIIIGTIPKWDVTSVTVCPFFSLQTGSRRLACDQPSEQRNLFPVFLSTLGICWKYLFCSGMDQCNTLYSL